MNFENFQIVYPKPTALKDVTNSRRVGQVLTVSMIKQQSGLGFTIVSRDTAGAGESPMLINRITPNGIAAKSDLCIGDRLVFFSLQTQVHFF